MSYSYKKARNMATISVKDRLHGVRVQVEPVYSYTFGKLSYICIASYLAKKDSHL